MFLSKRLLHTKIELVWFQALLDEKMVRPLTI